KKYACELLERANMVNCNPSWTPVDTDSKLGPEGVAVQDHTLYRSLAGGLQYLTFTRPDLSYVVQQISLYMHDPREPHFAAIKRILRYVRGTVDFGLQLYASATTSFVGAEAEYRGVANVVVKTAWLRNLLLQHQRTKHTEIDIHFVRDMVQTGHIRVLHVPSRYQYADIFTKGLPTALFEDFRSSLSSVSMKKLHGYGHLEEIVVKRSDQQLYKFKECDFVDLHLNDIKDTLLFAVQHKLFHLDGSDIVDFIVALRIVYVDLNKQKRVLRDELYKFSDGTLKSVRNEIHHRSVSVKKLHGYGHLEEIVVKRSDQQLYKFKEYDFVDLHLNDIEDMLLFAIQHKLFHLDGSDIVDFIVALRMFTRSLILKRRVEDLQLGGENLNKQKRVLQDELYKFSDGTLKSVRNEIHHRVLDFHLHYNPEMPKMK
nr:ribonuclease H-like domain-containing protein [Tanacetum cinerariifolium]